MAGTGACVLGLRDMRGNRAWRGAVTTVVAASLVAGCGGGGSNGGESTTGVIGAATPTSSPTPTAGGCTLRSRQDWAAATLREWYLFPETLPASADPSTYPTVAGYIDALTATARSQRRDRFFTYLTSIAEENAYYQSGETAGFGVRLSYDPAGRVTVAEAFEGAPALAAGIDRGAEILAIGPDANSLRDVSAIYAAGGQAAVSEALGPGAAGTTRALRFRSVGSAIAVATVTKADFNLQPVSPRYGAKVIEEGGRRYGYLALRTFISTADAQLRQAFATFRAAGVTDIVVDLRYNGGGLVSTAELLGDLLGGGRQASEVFSYTTYRPEKASRNGTRLFRQAAESVAPTRLAFIGTGATASASELVVNSIQPYLRERAALIGANTFGKPVGQVAIDRSECDDRLRVVAFATQNAERRGDYYDGLATTVSVTCRAADELRYPLGDPNEASTRAALDFLAGRPCTTPITAEARTASAGSGERRPLVPDLASTAQRETPGLF